MKRFMLWICATLLPYVLFAQAATTVDIDGDSNTRKKVGLKVEMGVLAGNKDNQKPTPFSLLATFNYHLTQKIAVGAGTGIEFLNETGMPLFLSTDYRWKKTPTTPFLFARGGYYISLDDEQKEIPYMPRFSLSSMYIPGGKIADLDAQGGWFGNAGIGYIYHANKDLTFSLSLGYRYQKLNYEMDKYDYKIEAEHHRLTIYFGIIF